MLGVSVVYVVVICIYDFITVVQELGKDYEEVYLPLLWVHWPIMQIKHIQEGKFTPIFKNLHLQMLHWGLISSYL